MAAEAAPGPNCGSFGLRPQDDNSTTRPNSLDMTRKHTVAAGIILTVLLPACTDAGGESPGFVTRDSAGVVIAESTTPAWEAGAEWSVSGEPTVRIGMLDGPVEYQLSRVRGALLTPQGHVVVGNGGTGEIRWYDSAGTHLRTVGGEGDGPGEFRDLDAIGYGDGLIHAWDVRAKRISRFDENGTFLESVGVPATADVFYAPALGFLGDGSMIVSLGNDVRAMMNAPEGRHRPPQVHLRVHPDGRADSLATIPGPEADLSRSETGGFSNQYIVFGARALVAVGSEYVVVADNEGLSLRVLGSDGTLLRSIRVPVERVRATADMVEYERERMLDAIPAAITGDSRTSFEESIRSLAANEWLPQIGDLLVDGSDHIWVERFRVDRDGAARWSVFDPDGRWLGDVETPAGLRIMDISENAIIGLTRDDLDVEYVHVYELVKG